MQLLVGANSYFFYALDSLPGVQSWGFPTEESKLTTQRIRSNQFPGDIRHDSKTLTEFKTSVTLEMFVISYSMQYSSLPHNHLSR